MDIQFNDGTVSLSGEADSAEAMEKAVLMAGNIQGVSDLAADNLTSPPAAQKVEYDTIVKGDTLSAIAKQRYDIYRRVWLIVFA